MCSEGWRGCTWPLWPSECFRTQFLLLSGRIFSQVRLDLPWPHIPAMTASSGCSKHAARHVWEQVMLVGRSMSPCQHCSGNSSHWQNARKHWAEWGLGKGGERERWSWVDWGWNGGWDRQRPPPSNPISCVRLRRLDIHLSTYLLLLLLLCLLFPGLERWRGTERKNKCGEGVLSLESGRSRG